jgi:hypothetical protein
MARSRALPPGVAVSDLLPREHRLQNLGCLSLEDRDEAARAVPRQVPKRLQPPGTRHFRATGRRSSAFPGAAGRPALLSPALLRRLDSPGDRPTGSLRQPRSASAPRELDLFSRLEIENFRLLLEADGLPADVESVRVGSSSIPQVTSLELSLDQTRERRSKS